MLFSVPAPYSCTGKNQVTYLNSTSGSLASYNYPLPYDGYAHCNMDSNYKIKLWFDFFNVSCNDSVRLLNKKYCGSEKPPPLNLTTSDTVYFWSSGLDKYPGFKASYEADEAGKNWFCLAVCLSVRLYLSAYFVCPWLSVCLSAVFLFVYISICLPLVVIRSKGGCRVSELIPI